MSDAAESKVAVIVPAAGAGKRFGGKGSKILQRIGEQPIFIRTLELFTNRDDVCDTQLVVSPRDMDELKQRFGGHLGFMGVRVVEGGPTRAQSVKNALAGVPETAAYVCVHDAVRPCVSHLWVDAVFAEARKTGAAILAIPVHGTLKKVSDARVIEQTVPRGDLWEAQTPQVFRRDLLVKAYEGNLEGATDDAQLVEALGHPVSVVPGDPRNVKITTPRDLRLAAAVIRSLPKPKPKGPSHPFAEAQW
ncbi:MAG TPA: 2-C-methyl-D-erythritol 4-phosphate cytidylyltransferase [Phycisphaerae bacterium]|nr:2-C-methyl-D-erythritol 4-phosphate cytidylyltransferase [Phycisphaerae bacterium]HUT58846.1 2-C-methyl-D-erythritol 4-phosphate cytidylyltransferase [Phycisphaerae bacterium]